MHERDDVVDSWPLIAHVLATARIRLSSVATTMPSPTHVSDVPRVLVVDDEEAVRSFAAKVLQDGGYDVVVASDGPEALRLVEQQLPFDLFVIDVMMPQMRGDELARQLRHLDPDVKVLYFTGYADRLFQEKLTLWLNEAFIEKPVSAVGLLESAALLLFGHTGGPQATKG